jgi:hypothetical protein
VATANAIAFISKFNLDCDKRRAKMKKNKNEKVG